MFRDIIVYAVLLLLSQGAGFAFLRDLGEEIVALVINEDECGEILNLNLPDSLHAQLGILEKFNLLDAVLGKDSGGAADRSQIESAVLVASVGHLLAAVALGDHHH